MGRAAVVKAAIYIEEGVVQLVLTPEGKTEKGFLDLFKDKTLAANVAVGQFYECAGGFTRHGNSAEFGMNYDPQNSLIVRAVVVPPPPPPPPVKEAKPKLPTRKSVTKGKR